ncbi:MAG TPA: hypothetical protein VMT63_08160 [Bacteroidales bacterium]|nr:hypothetical protein [Bacteroidales bacterium]
MDNPGSENHDFTTISPSARWLLLMKGHTTVPYARRAAELIEKPTPYKPDFKSKDLDFWIRTLHFEMRYRGIDSLLSDLGTANIIELSSGFSFRGLQMVNEKKVHFIDTDLPGVIALKKGLADEMEDGQGRKGHLEMASLNVLDREEFEGIIRRFGEGPVAIINEGLMMYLNPAEKDQFAGIVRDILKKRGGYWIVGDIYVKNNIKKAIISLNPRLKEYYRQQNIEENRFDSFEDAELFFIERGFKIDREAGLKFRKLSAFPFMIRAMKFRHFFKYFFAERKKIHAIWRLCLADG